MDSICEPLNLQSTTNPGYYQFGELARSLGAKTTSLTSAPTAESLKGLSVYIIVDPDNTLDNPKPNYVSVCGQIDMVANGIGSYVALIHNLIGCLCGKYHWLPCCLGLGMNWHVFKFPPTRLRLVLYIRCSASPFFEPLDFLTSSRAAIVTWPLKP